MSWQVVVLVVGVVWAIAASNIADAWARSYGKDEDDSEEGT